MPTIETIRQSLNPDMVTGTALVMLAEVFAVAWWAWVK